MRPNPCKGVCPTRTPVCHCSCQEYMEWAAERKQENQAIRIANAPDRVLRDGYIEYVSRAKLNKKRARMFIHK